jgi:hypothetical protein
MTAPTMAEAGSDWVEWAGGECPVDSYARVHIILRDGTGSETTDRRILPVGSPMLAGTLSWRHGGPYDPETDIVAYRIVRP